MCTLSAINDVLSNTDFDSLIWTGDINADFNRKTQFTKINDEFIEEKALVKSCNKFSVDFTHSQETRNRTYTSTLDHFFWSERLSESIVNADVLHLPENTSDHCPIFCSIDLDRLGPIITEKKIPKSSKVSWIKATAAERSNYVDTLANRLRSLDIPPCTGCFLNVNRAIEKNAMSYWSVCFSPSNLQLTIAYHVRKSPIAFWEVDVQPFKDCSLFWHSIWNSAGRRLNTELHRIMKRTRNAYHTQIRKNKRLAENLKRNAFLQACLDNKCNIFSLIRKELKATNSIPAVIDGVSTKIENKFAETYERLYNSVDDKGALTLFTKRLSVLITASSTDDVQEITPNIVQEAINLLKRNKTDPVLDFNSDCIKIAPFAFCEILAIIFRHFVTHGHVSSFLMISVLIPIIKDKLGDISSSDNYRSKQPHSKSV